MYRRYTGWIDVSVGMTEEWNKRLVRSEVEMAVAKAYLARKTVVTVRDTNNVEHPFDMIQCGLDDSVADIYVEIRTIGMTEEVMRRYNIIPTWGIE